MDARQARILDGLDLSRSMGIELGPMDRPLVSKAMGSVLYVDRFTTDELRRMHADEPEYQTDKLWVDAVWRDRSLWRSIGGVQRVDYVIASHVVEHTDNLVGWLKEIHDVLRPTGSLRLVVPDKRFTFDHERDCSRPADVLAAWSEEARHPNRFCVLDFLIHQCEVDGHRAWSQPGAADPRVRRTPKQALEEAQFWFQRLEQVDLHCWVFTPTSFANIMRVLAMMELVSFRCERYMPPLFNSNEFIVSLAPGNDPVENALSWERMRDEEEVAHLAWEAKALRARMAALHRRPSALGTRPT